MVSILDQNVKNSAKPLHKEVEIPSKGMISTMRLYNCLADMVSAITMVILLLEESMRHLEISTVHWLE